MTLHVLNLAVGRPPAFGDTDDLIEALGIGFSDQQLDAITAPLEPGVIIAGAGSGKTTVMAARVVWLVGTGAVRPEEVLGLTFTRKAAAELSHRVRTRPAAAAGVIADRGVDESGEQLIMTYDAFAARLVAEHGLRLGFEADSDDDHRRHALPAGLPGGASRPPARSSSSPGCGRPRSPSGCSSSTRDLQQHLVDPTELDHHARDLLIGLESAPQNQPRQRLRRRAKGPSSRPGAPRAGQPGAGLPAAEGSGSGWSSSPTRWRIAARLVTEVPPVSRRAAVGVPGGTAGRVPGHLGRAGDHAAWAVLRLAQRRTRPPGDRGRRSLPGHLRLARRGGEQHHLLRRRLPPAGRAARAGGSRSP